MQAQRGSVAFRRATRNVCVCARATKVPKMSIDIKVSFESFYRVVLVYNGWTDDKDKDVALKVKQAVDMLSFGEALTRVRNARTEDVAILVTVPKDDAVLYMGNLFKKGLEAQLDEA